MSYEEVTIGSSAYDVYANVADSALYLDATITESGTAWRASDSDTQSRALVSATRWLDAANWSGTKTVADQALAWPRTGISDLDVTTIPIQLKYACIELAAMLVADPDLRANLLTAAIRQMRAGSVHVIFFRPQDVQTLTFFPASVMSFVGQWMGAASGTVGAIPNDVCAKSKLERPYDFEHGL